MDFVSNHDKAITFDLLTKTNYTLDDVGGELSWFALSSFVQNLGTDSALARDMGKSTGWEDTLATNRILADIYDLLQVINTNLCDLGSGKTLHRKIKPYPRPNGKDKDTKRIGKGALPPDELREWFENRRKQHHGKRN